MDRTRRVRIAAISTAAGLLGALALGVAYSQADDPGTTFDTTFTSSGEHDLFVPEGVTAIDVVATGGRGASIATEGSPCCATAAGGLGARVSGRLTGLTSGEELFLEVGGNGSQPDGSLRNSAPGGFNGGGDADAGPFGATNFWNVGGGGGGASDVRTDSSDLGTRLIVAAGGGGGGHQINSSTATGGNGGAGFGGSGAAGGSGAGGASSGGQGGHGASSSAGGAGGTTGSGIDGTSGSLGQGGDGGYGPNNNPGGGGGGGGGGRYGGGGGQGGGAGQGGGGGGGGSSLIPAGGSIAVAPGGSNGSIEVSYTVPGTDIDSGPTGSVTETAQSFSFSSSDPDATFECRFDSTDEADFAPCTSPYEVTDLALGQHAFDVRAFNSMGNFDPTPASQTFTVVTIPPPTTTTPPGPGPTQPVKKAKCKKKKHKRAAEAKKKKCKKKRKKK